MKREIEYYLGYLRNPKQKMKNGFDEVKESEVIIYKDGDDYREVVTNEKIYVEKTLQVFDGHRVTEANASFIGRVGKKLENKEASTLMEQIRKNNMANYISIIYTLMQDTKELAASGEQEYLEEVEKVKNTFRK